MTMRSRFRRSGPVATIPAILALLALAPGGPRVMTPVALAHRAAALPADVDPLVETLAGVVAKAAPDARSPDGAGAGPLWIAARRCARPGEAPAPPPTGRARPPEDAALRGLERAGRLGAPSTAPPRPS